jgi:hypothetical protein
VKTKLLLVAAGWAAFGGCIGAAQAPPSPAADTGIRHLIQAFAGFNQPNDVGLPCASPCFQLPSGTVAVQPNSFVSGNSAGLYYAVFQTDGWTGDLSTTFELSEAGNVVQTVTAGGSIGTDQATAAVVISTSATIPDTGYSGPATIRVTTTATRSDGSAPFTLESFAPLEVGTTGTHRLVQAFAGVTPTPPCLGLCFAVPTESVTVQLGGFVTPSLLGDFYAIFQAGGWDGILDLTFDVTEAGKVFQITTTRGTVAGSQAYSVVEVGASGYIPQGGYNGPAVLKLTTAALPRNGAPPFNLSSYTTLQVQ